MSNSDGRAGMAAVAGEVDIEHLAKVRFFVFKETKTRSIVLKETKVKSLVFE